MSSERSPGSGRPRAAILAGILAVSIGCGRKAPPVAPEDLRPGRVENLGALDRPEGFLLEWTAPSTRSDGAPLEDLAGFRIVRVALGASPTSEQTGPSERYDLSLSDLGLGGHPGRIAWLDRTARAPGRYRYHLAAVNEAGDPGDPAPPLTVVRSQGFPPPPLHLEGTVGPEGCRLTWSPPALQDRSTFLYNVYRMPATSAVELPLNAAPLSATAYTDDGAERRRPVRYTVRTVVETPEGGRESPPSNEVLLVPGEAPR